MLTSLKAIDGTFVKKAKPEKVKGYLWLRVIIIKVIVGAVVGVVGFVQQLYCHRPAERLGDKRVLEEREPIRKTRHSRIQV